MLLSVCIFSTESGCRFGDRCRFAHSSGDAAVAADKLGDSVKDGVDTYGAGLPEVTVDTTAGGVEAVMASLSVMDSSQPVTAADDLSAAGACACPSASTLHSASPAAAAAAKCSRKKKRTGKKGARKMKQESKSKELVLYDHQTVKCGMLVLQCTVVWGAGLKQQKMTFSLTQRHLQSYSIGHA